MRKILEKLRDILARLDAAGTPADLDLPGFRLHALKGDLAGFWAVTVRANWRLIFRFTDQGERWMWTSSITIKEESRGWR